jgi:hypothetical protein
MFDWENLMSECLDKLTEAFGDTLDKRTLAEIQRTVVEKYESLRAASAPDVDNAVRKWAEGLVTEAEYERRRVKRSAIFQARAVARVVSYLTDNWSGDVAKGLDALIGGVHRNIPGARDSLHTHVKHLMGEYSNTLASELDKIGPEATSLFATHTMDNEIAEAVFRRARGQDISDLPEQAVKIADTIRRVNEKMRLDANSAGAFIAKLDDYLFRNSHDVGRIQKAGADAWTDYVVARIDWKKSFDTDNIDDARAILKAVYEPFARGEHLSGDAGEIIAGAIRKMNRGGVASRISKHRELHWNSGTAAVEYSNRFGVGPLNEAISANIAGYARQTATMRVLGPGDTEASLRKIIDVMKAQNKAGSETNIESMGKLWQHRIEAVTGRAAGYNNVPVSGTVKWWTDGLLLWNSVTKLGGAVLSALGDLANADLIARTHGRAPFAGMAEMMRGIVAGNSKDKQRMVRAAGVIIDDSMASRFETTDLSSGRAGVMSKIGKAFFAFNLLTPWTNRARTTYALMLMSDLAHHADRGFDALPDDLQATLNAGGLKQDWDTLRQGVVTTEDGKAFIDADAIEAKFGSEVAQKYGRFIVDRTHLAVVEKTAMADYYTTFGTKPGTPEGMFFRLVGQFKGFGLSVVESVGARELTFRSADPSFRGAAKESYKNWAGRIGLYMAQATTLGIMSIMLKDIAKNRTPQVPEDAGSLAMLIKRGMLQGGAWGIYGDFLMGEGLKNRHGGTFVSTLMGPTAGQIDKIANIMGKVQAGEDPSTEMVKGLVAAIPGNNLFYIKAPVEFFFLRHMYEMLNPGSTHRAAQRMYKDTGQTPWIE